MRIAWLTDTHFNFLDSGQGNTEYAGVPEFAAALRKKNVDVIIVTGDISTAQRFHMDLRVLHEVTGVDVFFVLGNHDFYHGESIKETRRLADILKEAMHVHYLRSCGPVLLSNKIALCGVDGWGDARLGNWMTSQYKLNDWNYIPDFVGTSHVARVALFNRMGENEAEILTRQLLQAKDRGAERIIVATHVPPFESSCWHLDGPSESDALPYFSCQATGDALITFAKSVIGVEPEIDIVVLCGHTHTGHMYVAHNNMVVFTGHAEYYKPIIQRVFDY